MFFEGGDHRDLFLNCEFELANDAAEIFVRIFEDIEFFLDSVDVK